MTVHAHQTLPPIACEYLQCLHPLFTETTSSSTVLDDHSSCCPLMDENLLVVNLGSVKITSLPRDRTSPNIRALHSQGTTEEEIMKTMMSQSYDRFRLNLEQMQILIALKTENWQDVLTSNQVTPMHLLQPTNLTIQLDKCLFTDDPRLPKLKINGSLPNVAVNITDDRLLTLLALFTSIPFPSDEEAQAQPLQESASRSSSMSMVNKLLDLPTDKNKVKLTPTTPQPPSQDTELVQFTELEVNFQMGADCLKQQISVIDFKISISQASENEKLLDFNLLRLEVEMVQKTFDMTVMLRIGGISLIHYDPVASVCLLDTPMAAGDSKYLFTVLYVDVNKQSPEFHTKHGSVLKLVDVKFTTLDVLLHQESLLTLLAVSNNFQSRLEEIQGKPETGDRIVVQPSPTTLPTRMPLSVIPEEESVTVDETKVVQKKRRKKSIQEIDLKIAAYLEHFKVEIGNRKSKIAVVLVQGAVAGVIVKKTNTVITAKLKDFVIHDPNPETIHPNIISIMGQEAMSAQIVMYNEEEQDDSIVEKVDMSVQASMACLRIVFLNWFVSNLLKFLNSFQQAQKAIVDAAAGAAEAAKQNMQEAYEKAAKLSLDIKLQAPIIVIPVNSKSNDTLILDFGNLTLYNKFKTLNVRSLKGHPAVVDELNLDLQNLKLSRAKLDDEAKEVVNESLILQPITFGLLVLRNLSAGWYKEIPDLDLSGRLESINFSRKMTERIEQRYCIKFCQKLDDSQSQTIRKIQQVFGEDAMSVTQIKEWFNQFKDGRTSAESEQHCGRPQTARSAAVVERVRNLVMADRRLTVREIAEEVGVSKDSAHAILRDDLNMNRVAAKFVPKLSPEQKDLHRDIAQELLDTPNTDPGFLNTVITGDESWVYGYDPETKRQSSQWKHPESPRPKKARQVRSKIKVMLTVFFDVRGIVHHEYAPEGQTVTKEYYHDVLRRLRDAVRHKRPDMWTAKNWHLHHDNAPAHSSQLIHTFLAKHGITTVRQPPYSPDLAPCDFWLFPKLKTPLKGSRFESREEIMQNATTELNTIPKEDFQRCFQQWKDCQEDYRKVMQVLQENFAEGAAQEPTTPESAEQEVNLAEQRKSLERPSTLEGVRSISLDASVEEKEKGADSAPVYTSIKFTFTMESLIIDLFTGGSKDLHGVSSPLHLPENGLGRFSLHILSLKGRILSDSSIITSILLVDCLLDDTRFNSDSKIKRLMERKSEAPSNASPAVEAPFRSMIDLTYQQKGSEMFVDLRIYGFTLTVCLSYLMKVADFFTSGLEPPTPPVEETTGKTASAQQNQLTVKPSKSKPSISKSKSATTTSVAPQQTSSSMMTVNIRVEKPDIILVENMDDLDTNAIILNILHPCSISLAGSTPEGQGLHLDICTTDIRLRVSPATIGLLSNVQGQLAVSADEAEDGEKEVDYADIWTPKKFEDSEYWFLKTEVGEDAVLTTETTLEPAPPTGELCIVTAPSVVITMEAGVGSQTLPMILAEIGFQGSIVDWSTQMSLSSCLALQVAYYNSQLALWEPLIEPVEQVKDGRLLHCPWELRADIHMNSQEPIASPMSQTASDIEDIPYVPPAMSIEISSKENLELTMTKTCLDVLTNLGKAFQSAMLEGPKKPKPVSPYLVQNDTGLIITIVLNKGPFQVQDSNDGDRVKQVVLQSGAKVGLCLEEPEELKITILAGTPTEKNKVTEKFLTIRSERGPVELPRIREHPLPMKKSGDAQE
ncbi:hypothetical protein ANN_01378 [Periplaneta americana]|uniref:Uncharacterized protein n=1 Tax=Periplaneta americana TaxID=6978 RepID=A0ABQ8TVU5_PERAM|nr:hypothetical protein ANN_01378 [Periplaneta americana]